MELVGIHTLVGKARWRSQARLLGIAKGYAIDLLAELLEARGHRDYLIELGGEIRVAGRNLDRRPWRIGLEHPDPSQLGSVRRTLNLAGGAIATSGDYRNFLDAPDQPNGRASHLIDPRTGRPIHNDLTSVSVLHDRAMWADAWATALIVAGKERALRIAAQQNLRASLVVRLSNGDVREIMTNQ